MHPFLLENLSFSLRGRKILLGITGSIAAFKACDLIRILRGAGAEVRVVLSEGAKNFVTPTTLETLSGAPVLSTMWLNSSSSTLPESSGTGWASHGTHHISAARWADAFVVAPATAHTLAKLAHGFADDLLSTEALAFQGPLVVAPAMNPAMYSNPATQANLTLLRSRSVVFAGPEIGKTSCGEEGEGRMSTPEVIAETIAQALTSSKGINTRSLNGRPKKIVITLGPTRSAIDAVRFLTNRSSGKMGACLGWASLLRGYETTIIAGPLSTDVSGTSPVVFPHGARLISVQTTEQMAAASEAAFQDADIFVSAAAVLDWECAETFEGKLKKNQGTPEVRLRPAIDILKQLGSRKRAGQVLIGFAAEFESIEAYAHAKLEAKNCDAIFANPIHAANSGFESDHNQGFWIARGKAAQALGPLRKSELAHALLDRVEELVQYRSATQEDSAPPVEALKSEAAPLIC